MKTIIKIFLAFLLLAASRNAFAVTVSKKSICQGAAVPAGWVIADKTLNRNTCGNPTTPQGNVWQIERYDNLPVGTPLVICSFSSPVPSGWTPTSFETNATVCGAQYGRNDPYNTVTIKHTGCINESATLCYPPPGQFAVISAWPTRVVVPYGQSAGSTEVGWFASMSSACVWVLSGGVTQLWRCDGNYGVHTWPYVPAGGTQTFVVSSSSTSASPALASVTVNGVEGAAPKIYAAPRTVTVPAGQTGSTTISYNLVGTDYSSMCIWVSNNGSPAQLWACGSGMAFAQVWPYVPKGGTSVFWLNPSRTSSSQILASVIVTGK